MKYQSRVFRMLLTAREQYSRRGEPNAGLSIDEFLETDTAAWRAGAVKATLTRSQFRSALRGLMSKGTIEQLASGRWRVTPTPPSHQAP